MGFYFVNQFPKLELEYENWEKPDAKAKYINILGLILGWRIKKGV